MSQKIQMFCDVCSEPFARGARLSMSGIEVVEGAEKRNFIGGGLPSLHGIDLCGGCVAKTLQAIDWDPTKSSFAEAQDDDERTD